MVTHTAGLWLSSLLQWLQSWLPFLEHRNPLSILVFGQKDTQQVPEDALGGHAERQPTTVVSRPFVEISLTVGLILKMRSLCLLWPKWQGSWCCASVELPKPVKVIRVMRLKRRAAGPWVRPCPILASRPVLFLACVPRDARYRMEHKRRTVLASGQFAFPGFGPNFVCFLSAGLVLQVIKFLQHREIVVFWF